MRRLRSLARSMVFIASLLTVLIPVDLYSQDWLSARSEHYRILGTADDDDLIETGVRLEGFYTAVNTFFRGQQFRKPAATTLIVLDDDDDVEDLGLTPEADGYFRSGEHDNFIILSPESRRRKPFAPILRDFFLSIADANLPNIPAWVREGLAEFYSTIEFDDELLVMGRHIEPHVKLLKDDDPLPYTELFEITPDLISSDNKRTQMFSAQSWALIHFLMLRNRGPGLTETAVFVHSIAGGVSFEEAFRTAFGADFSSLRSEFEDYLDQKRFPFLRMTVSGIGEEFISMDQDPFPPAQGETYLADLLFEEGRVPEAERRLQMAIARDSSLSAPRTSLGRLLLQEERDLEALETLQEAIEGENPSHLSHYYYALAFSRVNSQLDEEKRTIIRERLEAAINLGPDFPDAHHELAITYVDAGDDLGEAAKLLDKALTLSPDQPSYLVTLSRVLVAQGFPDAAKGVLDRVLELSDEEEIHRRVRAILDSIG